MDYVKFHHYGLALKKFDSAVEFHNNLGYKCSKPIVDPLQKVELILCTSDKNPTVELVKPISDQSPINNYLKNYNEMFYHVCYEIDNFEKCIEKIFPKESQKKNLKTVVISSPKPAILFNNRLVAFYYVEDLGVIEVLQK